MARAEAREERVERGPRHPLRVRRQPPVDGHADRLVLDHHVREGRELLAQAGDVRPQVRERRHLEIAPPDAALEAVQAAGVEAEVGQERVHIGDRPAGDDRHRAVAPRAQPPEEPRQAGRDPDGVRTGGDLDERAVEIQEQREAEASPPGQDVRPGRGLPPGFPPEEVAFGGGGGGRAPAEGARGDPAGVARWGRRAWRGTPGVAGAAVLPGRASSSSSALSQSVSALPSRRPPFSHSS